MNKEMNEYVIYNWIRHGNLTNGLTSKTGFPTGFTRKEKCDVYHWTKLATNFESYEGQAS